MPLLTNTLSKGLLSVAATKKIGGFRKVTHKRWLSSSENAPKAAPEKNNQASWSEWLILGIRKDWHDEVPKYPRLIFFAVLTYVTGTFFTEEMNERQEIQNTLKKARNDLDDYRITIQNQLNRIETVSLGLSRAGATSSDKHYKKEHIEKDIEELDRTISMIEIHFTRIKAIYTPAILNNRGLLYCLLSIDSTDQKELLEKALVDLELAEQRAPNDEIILFNRATTKFYLGDIDGAASDLQICQDANPHMANHPHLLYLLAGVASKQGNTKQSSEILKIAKDLVLARQKEFGTTAPIRIDEYVDTAEQFLKRIEDAETELKMKTTDGYMNFFQSFFTCAKQNNVLKESKSNVCATSVKCN